MELWLEKFLEFTEFVEFIELNNRVQGSGRGKCLAPKRPEYDLRLVIVNSESQNNLQSTISDKILLQLATALSIFYGVCLTIPEGKP